MRRNMQEFVATQGFEFSPKGNGKLGITKLTKDTKYVKGDDGKKHREEYTTTDVPVTPTQKETLGAIYKNLRSQGKDSWVNQKYDVDPKPDVVFKGNGYEINPDNGKASFMLDDKEVEAFVESKSRRLREADKKQATITLLYDPRWSYQQSDISDDNFDCYFDDGLLYNGWDGYDPSKNVKKMVEEDEDVTTGAGLAQFISEDYDKGLYGKVESILFDFDVHRDKLVVTCTLAPGVNPYSVLEPLKDYLSGQMSDGWGEGFEQQEVDRTSLWFAYDDTDDYGDASFFGDYRSAESWCKEHEEDEEAAADEDEDYEPHSFDYCEVNISIYCSFWDRNRDCLTKVYINGRDEDGYDREGFDKKGFDRWGHDKDGYDKKGFKKDYKGVERDREGYDAEGFDAEGKDREGFDKTGHKAMSDNRPAYGKSGKKQGALFQKDKSGKITISNTFDMGESRKRKANLEESRDASAERIRLTSEEEIRECLDKGITIYCTHTGPFGEDEGATVIAFGKVGDADIDGLLNVDSEDMDWLELDDFADWSNSYEGMTVVVLDKNIGQSNNNFFTLEAATISDLDLYIDRQDVTDAPQGATPDYSDTRKDEGCDKHCIVVKVLDEDDDQAETVLASYGGQLDYHVWEIARYNIDDIKEEIPNWQKRLAFYNSYDCQTGDFGSKCRSKKLKEDELNPEVEDYNALVDFFRIDMLKNTIFLDAEEFEMSDLTYYDFLDCMEEVIPTWAGIDTVEKAINVLQSATVPLAKEYLDIIERAKDIASTRMGTEGPVDINNML